MHPARLPFWHIQRLADDRGTVTGAGFSGAGWRTRWEGELKSLEPLDPATESVAIDGLRVPLVDRRARAEVRVEELPAADVALRHLRHRAARTELWAAPVFDDAVTLCATGHQAHGARVGS